MKSNPRHILVKSSLQLYLIAAYTTLSGSYPLVHAILYLSLVTLYTVCTFIIKPYNYERLNLWERVGTLAVLLYGIFGLLKQLNIPSHWLILSFLLSLLLFTVSGLVLQVLIPQYRSLLIQKRDDRYDIIQFAFTFGRAAQRHLQAFRYKHRPIREEQSWEGYESAHETIRRVPLPKSH